MYAPRGRSIFTFIVVGCLALAPGNSFAQMSNKPFQFSNGHGSIGMSTAARQALINQKLFNATPRNILKDSNGRLLVGPARGPGRTAIVASPSGATIPGYRGRDFRKGNSAISAGTFNAFFVPRSGGRSSGYYPVAAPANALVNTWTARVLTESGIGYGPGSPVNAWTGSVYALGPFGSYY